MAKLGEVINRTGEIHITKEGYNTEIIEYVNSHNLTIKFLYNGYIIKNKTYTELIRGSIKNPYHPSVRGIGYIGVGKYSMRKNNKLTKCYTLWKNIFRRCYDQNPLENPTYKDCSVGEEWHNYQNFGKWFEENYNSEIMDKWCLDKDVLKKGNRVYEPNSCEFVPREINNLVGKKRKTNSGCPLGVSKEGNRYIAQIKIKEKHIYLGAYDTKEEAFYVYKVAKEKEIKRVANKWKPLISEKFYTAIYNYKVEITD